MKRKNRLIKIDSETHEKAMKLSRELSIIENRRVPAGEIFLRTLSSDEIIKRLRLGSEERGRRI